MIRRAAVDILASKLASLQRLAEAGVTDCSSRSTGDGFYIRIYMAPARGRTSVYSLNLAAHAGIYRKSPSSNILETLDAARLNGIDRSAALACCRYLLRKHKAKLGAREAARGGKP